MPMRCVCGEILDDERPETTTPVRIFTETAWEEREVEDDWQKQVPYSYIGWGCRSCGRLYVFHSEPEAVSRFDVSPTSKNIFR